MASSLESLLSLCLGEVVILREKVKTHLTPGSFLPCSQVTGPGTLPLHTRQPRVQAWATVSLLYRGGSGYPSSEHASKNRRMRNQNSWMLWQELWLTVGPRVPRADGRLLLVLPALLMTLSRWGQY